MQSKIITELSEPTSQVFNDFLEEKKTPGISEILLPLSMMDSLNKGEFETVVEKLYQLLLTPEEKQENHSLKSKDVNEEISTKSLQERTDNIKTKENSNQPATSTNNEGKEAKESSQIKQTNTSDLYSITNELIQNSLEILMPLLKCSLEVKSSLKFIKLIVKLIFIKARWTLQQGKQISVSNFNLKQCQEAFDKISLSPFKDLIKNNMNQQENSFPLSRNLKNYTPNLDDLLLFFFRKMVPDLHEYTDYEQSIFFMSDFLFKDLMREFKFDLLHKFINISTEYDIYSLFPVFSIVLHSLCKNERGDLGLYLLNYFTLYKMEISTCAINNYIENLCKLGKIDACQKFFNEYTHYVPESIFPFDKLKEKGMKFEKLISGSGINIVSYGTFIKYLCKLNLIDLAINYYEELYKNNELKDEVIFNSIINGCAKLGKIETMMKVYNDMNGIKIKPSIITYNTMIDAYVRKGMIPQAWMIFSKLIKKQITPDNFTLSTLFKGINKEEHRKYLKEGFDIIKGNNGSIDIILINVLMDDCIKLKDKENFCQLFDDIIGGKWKDIEPDLITYNTFFKGCAQLELYDKVDAAFKNMMENKTGKIKPNDVTFNSLVDIYVRQQKMTEVFKIIQLMNNNGIAPDNFTFSTIIKGLHKNSLSDEDSCYAKNNEEYEKKRKIKKQNQNRNGMTKENVNQYLNALKDKNSSNNNYCNSNIKNNKYKTNIRELNLAFGLFEHVKQKSKPDEILYNCLMDACLRFNQIELAFHLYDEMIENGVKPSSISCGIAIKAYGMNKEVDRALSVYQSMRNDSIPVSAVTYGSLVSACIKNDRLDQAFSIFKTMAAEKVDMNTILCTNLINAYGKKQKLNQVLDIFERMKANHKIYPNVITYNSVIDCCVKCGNLDKAYQIFYEMLPNDFTSKDDEILSRNSDSKKDQEDEISTFSKASEADKNIDPKYAYISKNIENIINTTDEPNDNSPVSFNRTNNSGSKNENIKNENSVINSLLDSSAEGTLNKQTFTKVNPDIVTFNTLIKAEIKQSNFNKALYLLKIMFNLPFIKPDCVLLNSLLDGAEKCKRSKDAQGIFDSFVQRKVKPDLMSFSIMLKVYGKLHDFDNSLKIFELMYKENIKPNLIMATCFLKTCFSTKKYQEAVHYFNNFSQMDLEPDNICYSTMVNGLISADKNLDYDYCDVIVKICEDSINKKEYLNKKIYSQCLEYVNKNEKGEKKELYNKLNDFFNKNNTFTYNKNNYDKDHHNRNYKNKNNYEYKENTNNSTSIYNNGNYQGYVYGRYDMNNMNYYNMNMFNMNMYNNGQFQMYNQSFNPYNYCYNPYLNGNYSFYPRKFNTKLAVNNEENKNESNTNSNACNQATNANTENITENKEQNIEEKEPISGNKTDEKFLKTENKTLSSETKVETAEKYAYKEYNKLEDTFTKKKNASENEQDNKLSNDICSYSTKQEFSSNSRKALKTMNYNNSDNKSIAI